MGRNEWKKSFVLKNHNRLHSNALVGQEPSDDFAYIDTYIYIYILCVLIIVSSVCVCVCVSVCECVRENGTGTIYTVRTIGMPAQVICMSVSDELCC
jgi:hypothetical protein